MSGKILFVASTRSHILNFHLPYLEALRRDGCTIHGAWGGTPGDVPFVDEVLYLPFEKKMSSPRNFRAARMLRARLVRERYDAVIVHTSLAAFFTRLAVLGLRERPKLINMAHGYLFDDQTAPLKRQVLLSAERLTAPVTDLLLTMNHWDYQIALNRSLGKTVVNIPGIGVDFSRLDGAPIDRAAVRQSLGIPADAFVFIYPAEFSPRKSQCVLLQAMAELPDRAVLLLPGSGALLEECRAQAQALGIAERVIFPGYITEMGAWYPLADAAVSSSRSEGLPFNIMEAMYCGLPVAASAVKGHTDLIRDGESGLLYPYGDPSACAACLRRLMDDPELAARLAARAREDVVQYGLERVLPQVMAQYRSVLPLPAAKA